MANDMLLTCAKCGSQFFFTVGEQKYYKDKNLNIPKFCKKCRESRKEKNKYIPRACSTCYFNRGYGRCEFVKREIVNDAPCKNWARRPE